ncbi:DUF2141 domain-containing protein [Alteromonas lipolytica]|uniref:DUF2141 domain-containing protein n=1 Tax=Alteromonas lipolytica TaxID=1856405 RepID=A0A1E8FI94_9ALTE|nr:DUF2141 domain-containing protein [Alteromonas lipolytica]OFI35614.1 hypothetical protein BFC17_12725 [Alteromonas lipolytica]GGF77598.1 hypothetical protein GCM10011338_32470 [Alteromonas lipolytica]
MKTLLPALTSLYCISATAANVEIVFSDISSLRGELYIAAYNSADAFTQKQAFQSQIIRVYKSNQTAVLADLPAGDYSVMAFQDLDANRTLNSNMMGIPTEPYGFSTNPHLMGPPSFDAIRFTVGEDDMSITINME